VTGGIDTGRQAAFRKALAALPRLQRIVYLLHAMDGLSYNEIGFRIGEDVCAVEANLAAAMKLLVRHMDEPG